MQKKESFIRKTWLILAIITLLSSIGLVKFEADAVCSTFLAPNESVEFRTVRVTARSLYAVEINRKNEDIIDREGIAKPQFRHIQARFFSVNRFFVLLTVILWLLLATVISLHSDTQISTLMAGLCIVSCIHKKDGSK